MKHTVEELKLKAGTKGLLIDAPSSDTISIQISFRGGYQFADRSKFETPHLIEHHIFSATKNFPENTGVFIELGRNGANANASTSAAFISYTVRCAAFEVERILGLLHELIINATFPEERYLTERENVRSELVQKFDNWPLKHQMIINELNFPKLNLNYRDRVAQLDAITHQDVVNHYHATHKAHNGAFLIAGQIEANRLAIEEGLNAIFDALPKGEQAELWQGRGLGLQEPKLVEEKIDPVYFGIDWYAEAQPIEKRGHASLMRSVLTGGFGSRLLGKARDRGLTYHLSSGFSWSHEATGFGIGGYSNVDKWQPLLELITAEMGDLAENAPSQRELDEARDRTIGSILLGQDSVSSLMGWYAGEYLYDGEIMHYETFLDQLRNARREDVVDITRHFTSSPYHSAVLLGNVGPIEAALIDQTLKPIWQ